jgi:hypothetical protein
LAHSSSAFSSRLRSLLYSMVLSARRMVLARCVAMRITSRPSSSRKRCTIPRNQLSGGGVVMLPRRSSCVEPRRVTGADTSAPVPVPVCVMARDSALRVACGTRSAPDVTSDSCCAFGSPGAPLPSGAAELSGGASCATAVATTLSSERTVRPSGRGPTV